LYFFSFCVCTFWFIFLDYPFCTKIKSADFVDSCVNFWIIEAGEKVVVQLLFIERLAVIGLSNGDISIAAVAQSVERFLGKDEVMGSNPISS
jgi:hypothetical protein